MIQCEKVSAVSVSANRRSPRPKRKKRNLNSMGKKGVLRYSFQKPISRKGLARIVGTENKGVL